MSIPDHSETVLSGPSLAIARGVWIGLALVFVVTGVAGRIEQYHHLYTVCETCVITLRHLSYFNSLGLGLTSYVMWQIIIQSAGVLAWSAMGLLIFLRRSRDRTALVVSGMLVAAQLGGVFAPLVALVTARPQWTPVVLLVAFLGNLSMNSFFYVFPTGRFVPRWTAVIAVIASIVNVTDLYRTVLPGAVQALTAWPPPLSFAIIVTGLISWIGAPIYRYRHLSTAVQQQQIKWVVATIAISLIVFVLAMATFFLPGGKFNEDVSFLTVFVQPIGYLSPLVFIPIAIGGAILRYRLFDIDVIIRRTLVYTVVTALLALVYVGGVIVLQSFFQALTGQTSPLAVVASTLAIAALFTPLRRWVQNAVDRRFYRRKYNAEQVLAGFAATVRDEVELERLTEQLLGAVADTMQPAHISLWLKDDDAAHTRGDRG